MGSRQPGAQTLGREKGQGRGPVPFGVDRPATRIDAARKEMKPDKPQPELTDRERAQLAELQAKSMRAQWQALGKAFHELGEAIAPTWPFKQILRITRGILGRLDTK